MLSLEHATSWRKGLTRSVLSCVRTPLELASIKRKAMTNYVTVFTKV